MNKRETLQQIDSLSEVYESILKGNSDWRRIHDILSKYITDQEGVENTLLEVFSNVDSWPEGEILLLLSDCLCIGFEMCDENVEMSAFMKDELDSEDANLIQIDEADNKYCIVLI